MNLRVGDKSSSPICPSIVSKYAHIDAVRGRRVDLEARNPQLVGHAGDEGRVACQDLVHT